jgi:DNA-binding MurR/RpiR family transcriptional regulator
MRRMLRNSLLAKHAALGSGKRVRRFNTSMSRKVAGNSNELFEEFIEGNAMALQSLRQTVNLADIEQAIRLMDRARTLFVVGLNRSFPIASYLAYSLQQVGKHVFFLDGVGGFAADHARTLQPSDLLVVVSYNTNANESIAIAENAKAAGAQVLAISDCLVGPLAKASTLVLQAKDCDVRNVRSVGASLCLAQTLFVGLAFQREGASGGGREHHAQITDESDR